MARPLFCPNCGKSLPKGPHGAQGFTNTMTGDGGWDCFCAACKWSGDILPDSEDAKIEVRVGASED